MLGGGAITNTNVKSGAVYAVKTRADGTQVNYGLLAYHHKNPLIHYPVNFWIWVKRKFITG